MSARRVKSINLTQFRSLRGGNYSTPYPLTRNGSLKLYIMTTHLNTHIISSALEIDIEKVTKRARYTDGSTTEATWHTIYPRREDVDA